LPAPSQFTLPPPKRAKPRHFALSVAAHALLVAGLLAAYRGWKTVEARGTLTYLMDIRTSPISEVRVPPPPPPAAPRRVVRPLVAPRPETPVVVPEPYQPGDMQPPPGEPGGVTGGVPGGVPGGTLGLGPLAGDPRLWVRPMYIPEGGGRPINMDSVVRGRLLAMAVIADSLAQQDSMGITHNPYAPARWTFEHNGRTYGIDQNGIHFGSFTIPTAVLAFIPFPQGNIDQASANMQLMRMRADILQAAARAEAEDDFRRAVKQIRERRDRERREQREREERDRQRTAGEPQPIP
jgi:hypothetical protein